MLSSQFYGSANTSNIPLVAYDT